MLSIFILQTQMHYKSIVIALKCIDTAVYTHRGAQQQKKEITSSMVILTRFSRAGTITCYCKKALPNNACLVSAITLYNSYISQSTAFMKDQHFYLIPQTTQYLAT